MSDTIKTKADHVRKAIATGRHIGHTCHWPGCTKKVPPATWGCGPHWYKLPLRLRNKIWSTYERGQEISKTPSKEYIAVAAEVQAWIKTYLSDQP